LPFERKSLRHYGAGHERPRVVLVLDNGHVYSTSDNASGWDREAVHVSQDGSKITKDDDGEQLDVSKVGEASSGESCSGAGEEHPQDTHSTDGTILVLGDDSVWAVEGGRDQATAAGWTDSSTIHVSQEEAGSATSSPTKTKAPPESVTATHIGEK
jgi:hypothetical protein